MGIGVDSMPSFHLRRLPSLRHHFFAIRLIVVTSRSSRPTDVLNADHVFKKGVVSIFELFLDSYYLTIENLTILVENIVG